MGELEKFSGIQFDPDIVPILVGLTARRSTARRNEPTSCRPCSTLRILATSRWQLPPLSPPPKGTQEETRRRGQCWPPTMFLSVIALALVTGALAGGGIPRLAHLRLKLVWVLGVALGLRVGAVLLVGTDVGADIPVGAAFVVAYLLLFVFLAANYKVPGLQVAAVGIGLNTLAVILNAGQMPIWANAFEAAGFSPTALIGDPFHFLIASGTVAEFVSQGGVFGDVVPVPIPSSGMWSASATSCWRWASSGPSSTP